MITQHYNDKWHELRQQWPQQQLGGIQSPQISQAELNEFRDLLEKAREYDRKMNQPNCELEEKKKKLLKLAEELGVKIDFL